MAASRSRVGRGRALPSPLRSPSHKTADLVSVRPQHACAQGETDQFRSMAQPQLAHDARAVGLDRLRREKDPLTDLAGGVSLRGQPENLALAHAQLLQRFGFALLLGGLVTLQQESRRAGIEKHLVACNDADGLDQVLARLRLVDEATAASVENG